MTIRFASFNVENLFARPKAMNLLTWAEGRPSLAAFAEFITLINLANYTDPNKDRMIELLLQLEVKPEDSGWETSPWTERLATPTVWSAYNAPFP